MIISASRRTDLPAFHGQWFFRRLQEGYLLTPNPRNCKRFSKITLSPETVDAIVFWSKNPVPMESFFPKIYKMGYSFYFQFTLTPYGKEIEPGIPSKQDLINSFIRLSQQWGEERMVWRYDPIMISSALTVQWHLEQFENYAEQLAPYASQVVISFLDPYIRIHRWMEQNRIRPPSDKEMEQLAEGLGRISQSLHLPIAACSEQGNWLQQGILKSRCIDPVRIEKILGIPIDWKKDSGQRPECGCMESIDVGCYGTCLHGCKYCYAQGGKQFQMFQSPESPIMCGTVPEDAIITTRDMKSLIRRQLTF